VEIEIFFLTNGINTAKILTGRLVSKKLEIEATPLRSEDFICPEVGPLDRREEIYEKAMELFIAEGMTELLCRELPRR